MDEDTFEGILSVVPELDHSQFEKLIEMCSAYAQQQVAPLSKGGRFDPAWLVAFSQLEQAKQQIQFRHE